MIPTTRIRFPVIKNIFLFALFALFGSLVLTLGSCAALETVAETPYEVPDRGPTDVGNIVYSGEDGNIYTVDSRSGEITPITTQSERRGARVYDFSQAIWSPDGSRIGYSGSFFPEGAERRYYVYANNVETGNISVHESGVNQPPLYLQWSPDGSVLSYVRTSRTGRSIELVTWNVETGESEVVLSDRPLYYDWSPDGSFLVAHGGASAFRSSGGTIYIVRFHESEPGPSFEVEQLSAQAGFFQTPVINPTGDVFAVSLEGNDVANRIAFFAPSGSKQEEVAAVSLAGAFGWSPNGSRLAYLDGGPWQTGGVLGTLRIIDRHGVPPTARPAPASDSTLVRAAVRYPRRRKLESPVSMHVSGRGEFTRTPVTRSLERPERRNTQNTGGTSATLSGVNAFDWSPDGSRIAYFRPQLFNRDGSEGQRPRATLGVVDSFTGDAQRLDPVVPTTSLLGTYIPHFDQYNRSGTLWSPGSETLLLNAQTPEENRAGIYLVDVSEMERRLIAYGHMPFWRPAGPD